MIFPLDQLAAVSMKDIPDLIAELPPFWQWIIAGMILFVVVIQTPLMLWRGFIRGRSWLMNKFWPSRKQSDWVAQATPLLEGETLLLDLSRTDPDNGWRRDRVNWTHGREMRKGDAYTLLLGKHRVIDRIQFRSEGFRYPTRCGIRIRMQGNWQSLNAFDWDREHITYPLVPTRTVDAIEVSIIEPRTGPRTRHGERTLPPAWAIYDIELREVRLCGRWMRRWID